MKDPKRLRDHTDLPNGLHEALRGLACQAPPVETVERIQRSLSAFPNPPAPPSGLSLGWSASSISLAAGIGAVVVAAVVWMRAPQTTHLEAAPAAHDNAAAGASQAGQATTQPLMAADNTTAGAAPTAAQIAQPLVAATDNAAERAAPTAAQIAQPLVAATDNAAERATPTASQIPQPLAAATDNAAANVDAAATAQRSAALLGSLTLAPSQPGRQHLERRNAGRTSARQSPRAGQVQANETEPASQALAPSEEATAVAAIAEPRARTMQALPAPEDEASLLYRAKQATRTDHKAAFRMLDLHAKHFPNGALVEEREVLAIDLLRSMGRGAEAKERAARFLERFPASSYRNAVER